MPLVSVIINVRNGAATLREAIDSVLAQTFGDWELIIWDDRSTDDSPAIVSGYSDPRVHYYLSAADVSLGKARHDAIGVATAQWIAFLDQDDVWLPDKLQRQLALAADDVGLIYGRTIRFYSNGWQRDYDHAHEYEPLPEGDLFLRLFAESCFIAMSSAMFRSSAIGVAGGIPEEIRIIPDYALYVAVSRHFRARAVQEVICRYRMHPGSMSHTAALEMHREVLWLIDRWASDLTPPLVQKCRKRHHTAIALEEMRSPSTFFLGLVRLLSKGSLWSQLLRPVAFAYHVLRRILRPPYWQTLPSGPAV